MLNPRTDDTFMGIEDLIFSVGMEEGKAGEKEKINHQTGG